MWRDRWERVRREGEEECDLMQLPIFAYILSLSASFCLVGRDSSLTQPVGTLSFVMEKAKTLKPVNGISMSAIEYMV